MRALIRKYPDTPTRPDQDEIFIESQWPHWVQPNGSPLTDENYGYALCENCPETEDMTVEDFTVTEHTRTDTDDTSGEITVRYWTAKYIKG